MGHASTHIPITFQNPITKRSNTKASPNSNQGTHKGEKSQSDGINMLTPKVDVRDQ